MEGFIIRGWDFILPAFGSMSSRQSANSQGGLGFPCRAGGIDTGNLRFRSGCWSCRVMKGFPIRA